MDREGILKALEQDARLISERIPVTPTHNEALRVADLLKKFIEHRNLTQGQVARMLNVGPAKFNQFLGGKYTAEKGLEELINKSVQLMESYARKERRQKKAYVETTVAKHIQTLIVHTDALSDEEGRIGVIIGDGGHGKSVCLRQFAKANRNSVYVQLDDAMTSTTMFAAIAEKVNVDSSGLLAGVTRRLIENLYHRQLIIMLDEASGLSVKQLNQLRQIIVVKARCPLVLAGNADLLKTIMLSKARRGYESLDQFTSRLSLILNLDTMASSKGDPLYSAEDIRRLYQYSGLKLTPDAVALLKKICKSPRSGRLRTCSTVIVSLHTSKECKRAGCISAKHIRSAIEQLGLPVRGWLPIAPGEAVEEQEEKPAAAKAG